jgi:hypothetical protein
VNKPEMSVLVQGVNIVMNNDGEYVQYFGDDGEVGEVGEYFGEAGVISAGAGERVRRGLDKAMGKITHMLRNKKNGERWSEVSKFTCAEGLLGESRNISRQMVR